MHKQDSYIMKFLNHIFNKHRSIAVSILAILAFVVIMRVFAATPYAPGTSLDPAEGPGDAFVEIPITSPADDNGAVQFNNSGTFGGDDSNLFWNNSTKRLGIRTASPTRDLSFGGDSDRTIWLERRTTPFPLPGKNLILQAGGTFLGNLDASGGALNLLSGISTGSASSAINFATATAGSSGTSDNIPSIKMTILGSGNVGIGTASPADKLDVFGNMNLGDGVNSVLYLNNINTGKQLTLDTHAGGFGSLTFELGNSGLSTIDSSWGIIKTNSNLRFDTAGIAQLYTNNSDAGININGANSNATQLFIAGDGNVGIGTAAPATNLHISESSVTHGPSLRLTAASAPVDNKHWEIRNGCISCGWGDLDFTAFNDDQTVKGTRLTIKAGGNIGIGTASPANKLDVSGSLAIGSGYVGTAAPTNGAIIEGAVGIGTNTFLSSGVGFLNVAGNTARVFDTARTPFTSGETCNTGEMAFDSSYIYVCVTTDTWKRAAISTW